MTTPSGPSGMELATAGLSSAEAARRLQQYGPNAAPEETGHLWRSLLGRFWAPVPWMLEVTIVLELILGRDTEALVIGVLLVFNALLGFFQEHRAQSALALLRQRLSVQSRVRRDGRWQLLPARELVPGDLVHLRMGDLVPADLQLAAGQVLLDQAALTGESVPVEAGPGHTAYAGTIAQRGEATGSVVATGPRTTFGKTAELVRQARTQSHLEAIILAIVKYLVALDAVLVLVVFVYAVVVGIPMMEILPFALILLVASVPVALPATFTLATALGSLELARQGVLVTRLSAIEEAAAMDLLLTDKTGTLTLNQLSVAGIRPWETHTEQDVLRWAALASDESTQDPIDLAILAKARQVGAAPGAQVVGFVPFDPASKRSVAEVEIQGTRWQVAKGAPQVIAALAHAPESSVASQVQDLAADGSRVLAVACGQGPALELVGLLALQDTLRPDSAELVRDLHDLGVRVIMVTGDTPATGQAVAARVGLGTRVASPEALRHAGRQSLDFDLVAGVLPEDKFHLIQAAQQARHISGMTGDGVNDAPALKQAEVGIAVASATDVAKAAASLVLTSPGLANVVAAIQSSRRIYQRMLTYTLNKIIKTCEIALLLSLGLVVTGVFVTTPTLIVLLLFTNDFVTMSLATDHVACSRSPDRWQVRHLVLTALVLAALMLVLSFAIFFAGREFLRLPLPQLQTLVFLTLVFGGQSMVYVVRERNHFWHSRPSGWLALASVADFLIVSILATQGLLMAPLPWQWVLGTLLAILAYLLPIDLLKVWLMRREA